HIYVSTQQKAWADVGIRSEQVNLPAFVTEGELLAAIRRLNRDPQLHGVIVQLPLPRHISELRAQTAIDPSKDVDGLHPMNVGMMVRGEPTFPPATPYGIVELLLRSGLSLEGAEVVVVGHGDLVGTPLSIMLAQDSIRGNATVTICHVKTKNLDDHTRRADILVGGRFCVTGEVLPPRSADPTPVVEQTRALVGYVDAVNVTDNPTATAHMSPLAGVKFVSDAGIEPTVQLTSRDRNRLALTSD